MKLLPFLILVPLLLLLVNLVFRNTQEKAIYRAAILSIIANFGLLLVLTHLWIDQDFEAFFYQGPVVYHIGASHFSFNFFLDGYSLAYLFTATFITSIVIVFSRFYVHRERGYKRFFTNIQLFYFGLVTVLISGNFETMIVGWEILGVTSFLLIGFYRERYLPVKNALKVMSLYRLADIALLYGIWLCHHYFGHSINFDELGTIKSSHDFLLSESFYEFTIPAIFLLAAVIKSAQFPFSSWVPRAMEGPTTSSSIFYGSLSIHIGVFLLIRIAPLWENHITFQLFVGAIGLTTAIVASLIARVQSTIKTQIAYSSITQIGIMFMEVAAGFYGLAIAHFICNALLRSYQLLVSPSILSYKIHDQVFHFLKPKKQGYSGFWNKLRLSLFVLGIKEFNLDSMMFSYLWIPLKRIGNVFNKVTTKTTYSIAGALLFVGLIILYDKDLILPQHLNYFSEFFGILALILVLKAFVVRKSAALSWMLLLLNRLYQSLVFGFNEEFDFYQIYLFLSGIVVASILGFWIINKLKKAGKDVSLNQFNGSVYAHPILGIFFILACLGISGFPVSPTFFGEEMLVSHLHENQIPLLTLVIVNQILTGIVAFRIYARLFLGQRISDYCDFAYRSS